MDLQNWAAIVTTQGLWSSYTIYTDFGTFDAEIQTVACPSCNHSRRRIGPDLQKLVLFNWNNTIGFSRQLFDGFLSQYKRGETTFSAFWNSTNDTYLSHCSKLPFVSDSTFRRTYFAFADILQIDSGMLCPHPLCVEKKNDDDDDNDGRDQNGPWVTTAGCTLATPIKYTSGNLRPGTFTDEESWTRPDSLLAQILVLLTNRQSRFGQRYRIERMPKRGNRSLECPRSSLLHSFKLLLQSRIHPEIFWHFFGILRSSP